MTDNEKHDLLKEDNMTNNNFSIEYLLVNFHDNDFFTEMCKSAELIIALFLAEYFDLSKHKETIKIILPRFMASFNCSGDWSCDEAQKLMTHLEEYFSKGTTYLYGIEDIRKHVEQYNYDSEYPTKESGIYDDRERLENPLAWFNNLNLNMNAETIFIQFVSTVDGKPIPCLTTYRYF